MSNPTNPFSWQMPTPTDLVTDLPADFEVFGQAVATSLADLLGGSTGQVLSKATNADMDFAWVAQDDSNAIQNAIIDAKGDLIVGASADTPAKLSVGSNGQILTANSGATNGVEWAAPAGGSGLTLIERATFSSTTSIISGSVFSATYENYLILITVNTMTNAPAFEMRMRTGSTTTTTGYTFAQANASTSSTLSAYAAGNTSAWDLTSGDTTNGTFIRMHMANPYTTNFTHFNAQNDWTTGTGSMQVRNQAGFLSNGTSYDKFDIAAQYNVTGQYAVYGFAI